MIYRSSAIDLRYLIVPICKILRDNQSCHFNFLEFMRLLSLPSDVPDFDAFLSKIT